MVRQRSVRCAQSERCNKAFHGFLPEVSALFVEKWTRRMVRSCCFHIKMSTRGEHRSPGLALPEDQIEQSQNDHQADNNDRRRPSAISANILSRKAVFVRRAVFLGFRILMSYGRRQVCQH